MEKVLLQQGAYNNMFNDRCEGLEKQIAQLTAEHNRNIPYQDQSWDKKNKAHHQNKIGEFIWISRTALVMKYIL